MNSIQGLIYGFTVAGDPTNLILVLIGAALGTFIGVLPGIGQVGTIAVCLPIAMELNLSPEGTLIMFAGVFYGSYYGGSITSILINVPGEVSTVVTCIDGYAMSKQGRAGPALTVSAVGSLIGGTIGVVALTFFAPLLCDFALKFGPPEYFSLVLFSLLLLSRLVRGSIWRGLLALGIGLAIGTIGLDPITGKLRLTGGIVPLMGGIHIVPVVMGLVGISEIIGIAEEAKNIPRAKSVKLRELFPSKSEWRRSIPAALRATALGFPWGLIPGPSTILSTFASYKLERWLSKDPDQFGKGAIEGVVGPETANNAASSASFVPLLTIGIPFTPGIAMLLVALILQGVQPGPMLISEHPDIFWGVIASMYIGNVALLILNVPLVGMWVRVLRIPQALLVLIILVMCLFGAYSVNNNVFDLWVMMLAGVVGYIFKKLEFDVYPLLMGIVLGRMFEVHLRTSLYMSQGSILIFFQRPISATFTIIGLFVAFVIPILRVLWRKIRPKTSKERLNC